MEGHGSPDSRGRAAVCRTVGPSRSSPCVERYMATLELPDRVLSVTVRSVQTLGERDQSVAVYGSSESILGLRPGIGGVLEVGSTPGKEMSERIEVIEPRPELRQDTARRGALAYEARGQHSKDRPLRNRSVVDAVRRRARPETACGRSGRASTAGGRRRRHACRTTTARAGHIVRRRGRDRSWMQHAERPAPAASVRRPDSRPPDTRF